MQVGTAQEAEQAHNVRNPFPYRKRVQSRENVTEAASRENKTTASTQISGTQS